MTFARHPTERNVLVEEMACGCKLEITLVGAGKGQQPGRRRVALRRVHWADVAVGLGRLQQCAEHTAQWQDEDEAEEEATP